MATNDQPSVEPVRLPHELHLAGAPAHDGPTTIEAVTDPPLS